MSSHFFGCCINIQILSYILLILTQQWTWSASQGTSRNVLMLIADDAGFESEVYENKVCRMPNLKNLASRSVVFDNAFTTVSSCSPSRSTILTGLPQHQNGMYGLHNAEHNFNSFEGVQSLPKILGEQNIFTGIIGKKHVGPEQVYPFDYSMTEMDHSILQVGRNITFMKLLARQFFSQVKGRQFFLYVGFHDPHRCGHTHPEFGNFCEKFGNGEPGMGTIPDWRVETYKPEEVVVPYFVQNTSAARTDLAAQYTTISRLDQGIGLILEEMKAAGHLYTTLIVYTSDNGIPFPSGRTNLYDPGIREPLLLSAPSIYSGTKRSQTLVNHLDLVPTMLDWYNIHYPTYSIFKKDGVARLSGRSLLTILTAKESELQDLPVFGSHSLHEITMYYPMKSIRTENFKVIHNLNYRMPFPIDQDFFLSPSFQDLLKRSTHNKTLHWYKTLQGYYERPEWELFDLLNDPWEQKNLSPDPEFQATFRRLKVRLQEWQNMTADPWRCGNGAVLEDSGKYLGQPHCFSLHNGIQ